MNPYSRFFTCFFGAIIGGIVAGFALAMIPHMASQAWAPMDSVVPLRPPHHAYVSATRYADGVITAPVLVLPEPGDSVVFVAPFDLPSSGRRFDLRVVAHGVELQHPLDFDVLPGHVYAGLN